jgi:hypothetical protein
MSRSKSMSSSKNLRVKEGEGHAREEERAELAADGAAGVGGVGGVHVHRELSLRLPERLHRGRRVKP